MAWFPGPGELGPGNDTSSFWGGITKPRTLFCLVNSPFVGERKGKIKIF